jgi:hypothetical protein
VRGVLYHSHFEPSLAWLRTSLLVYDHVWSIVPPEAGYVPFERIKRHLEKLPDTFAPIAPHPIDIVHEYFVLKWRAACTTCFSATKICRTSLRFWESMNCGSAQRSSPNRDKGMKCRLRTNRRCRGRARFSAF